jgi:hypothetical protein
MGDQKKKEIIMLYIDAFCNHLERERMYDYKEEVEMRRRKARLKEL